GFNPESRRPYVTWTLLAATIVLFLLQSASKLLLGTDLLAIMGAKVNEYIYAGQIWRLVTPMFLHGSVLHIAFNMYALYIIGSGLELYYGHLRYLLLYLLGGFAGNVLSFAFTESASLGASTAVFGLIAAQGIFIYRNRFLFGNRAGRMLSNIVMIVIFNLVLGAAQPGIDNWGHLGGLLGGLLFAWFSGPEYAVKQEAFGLMLENKRTHDETWRTLILTGLLFMAIAAAKLFFLR
ncbi:MAG: rhomboid family intramembrane serine protease, partial [Anaerolineaceae bacterium]